MNKIVFLFLFMFSCYEISLSSELKQPTIVIAILIRNKAHTLPYFLSLIENINYPKSRISLWLRSDHNIDKSIEILNLWLENVYEQYHSVNTKFSEDKRFDDETGFAHWSTSRFKHVMSMREEALNYARNVWANYILMIDADAFLIDPDVLNSLISKDLTVVSPVLKSVGLYSNFWAAMSSDYYYNRSDDYEPILYRQKEGCFIVPMVHSSVLINLMKEESDHLTYDPGKVPNYDGPVDDIIVFALSANKSGVSLNVCNNKVFGFIMVPLEQDDDLEYDYLQLTNLKLEVLVENEPLRVNQLFEPYISLPKK
ncbi:glycosyltransferase 25 family member-like, partial [Photinus pyralis]